MSAKTSAARRAAFMAAVAETGNRTLAAERAKVSQSWVTLHRATDPAFKAELEAAVATFKTSFDRLRTNGGGGAANGGVASGTNGDVGSDADGGVGSPTDGDDPRPTGGEDMRADGGNAGAVGGGMLPPRGWRSAEGEELVLRAGNGRRTQIARARLRQWTPRIEARFLEALAGCCNVKAACALVGLTQVSAYNHRQRWDDFATRWDAALETGYLRLEAALLAQAKKMFEAFEGGAPGAGGRRDDVGVGGSPGGGSAGGGTSHDIAAEIRLPAMTVEDAMQLLRLHQKQVRDVGKAPGAQAKRTPIEEVNAILMRKIEAIERQSARTGVDAEADRRAVARGAAVVRGDGRA